MKRLIIGLFLILNSQIAIFGQSSATTAGMGYLKVTMPGRSSAPQAYGTRLSFPLQNPAVDSRRVTGVGADTLSATASWEVNQFLAKPYMVRLKSGSGSGFFFLITSNTANQLTVDTRGFNLPSLVSNDDLFEIAALNTLGSIFGTTSVPFEINTDVVVLVMNGVWAQFYYDGTAWKKSGSAESQNNAIIYPDEGMTVWRNGVTTLELVMEGVVAEVAPKSEVPGPQVAVLANPYPADMTLASLNLDLLPGWSKGAYEVADKVEILVNGATRNSYYHDGVSWKLSSNPLANQNSAVITAGSSFALERKSTATAANSVWSVPLPY